MEVRTLASGSSGNCILISGDGEYLLVDAGISCRRIAAALAEDGLTPEDLSGVFITHEHRDHTNGLITLTKRYHLPIYASPGTADALCSDVPGASEVVHILDCGQSFDLGWFTVETFPTSHDAAEPMGFTFSCGGRKAAVVTDLGYVSDDVMDGVLGCHLLLCEANHDVEMLKSGPYPAALKRRILGPMGHLCNEDAGRFAAALACRGTRKILLAHLSAENNTPAMALRAVETALSAAGLSPRLSAAPRDSLGGAYVLEGGPVCSG